MAGLQLLSWTRGGLWFQGPATRAPQDATRGSGVGVGEEAGGATPSGEQPLLLHHAPHLSVTHAFNGPAHGAGGETGRERLQC